MFNNSVIFSGKPIISVEFLNRMIETLGINRKNRMCCSYLN